ncbi:MAG TPA: MbnP family protein [Polyangia bacterium]
MKHVFLTRQGIVVTLTALSLACGSDKGSVLKPHDAAAADAPLVTDVTAPADVRPDLATDTGSPSAPRAGMCAEKPLPRGQSRVPVTFHVVLTHAGKPVSFGEPFPVTGGTLTLTNFRFFLSDFALVTATGETVPVDITDVAGTPAPYNVHLVNPESPAGMKFQLAVPPGDYESANFLFGLNDDCNSLHPSSTKAPLDHASQLTWPPPFGFLFLRYAGTLSNPMAPESPPNQLDMAAFPGQLFAPRVSASGRVQVEPLVQQFTLSVAIDEIFRASLMPKATDITIPMPPDISFGRGEHLRQNAGKVAIFSITSGR